MLNEKRWLLTDRTWNAFRMRVEWYVCLTQHCLDWYVWLQLLECKLEFTRPSIICTTRSLRVTRETGVSPSWCWARGGVHSKQVWLHTSSKPGFKPRPFCCEANSMLVNLKPKSMCCTINENHEKYKNQCVNKVNYNKINNIKKISSSSTSMTRP